MSTTTTLGLSKEQYQREREALWSTLSSGNNHVGYTCAIFPLKQNKTKKPNNYKVWREKLKLLKIAYLLQILVFKRIHNL